MWKKLEEHDSGSKHREFLDLPNFIHPNDNDKMKPSKYIVP